MHRPQARRLGATAALLLLGASLAAMAHAEVNVRLTAHKITKDARGTEVLEPAEKIKPGELVEYRAIYHNDGEDGVQKLIATLPIPPGMELQPRTASPAGAMASLDGKDFARMPLKRKVRLADGREVEREVPASEYRYLRWSLGTLPPMKEQTVRARVRVATLLSAESTENR
jgi:uncharacterized repeat protein (TIGR01451 family)